MFKWMVSLTTLMICLTTQMLSAQEPGEAISPREQGPWQMFIVLAIGLLFFYFILWRPEQKRRKAMETQRNAMKKGDRVTAMGIVGTVSKINENTVVLRMVDGAKIEMLKAAITDVTPATEEELKKIEKEG